MIDAFSKSRAVVAIVAAGFAGSACGTALETTSADAPSNPQMQVGRPISTYKQVAVAPLVGMPIQAQDQVVRSLNSSAMPLDIALLRQGDGAVVLRGYANAAVTKGKLSFEYFWDIQGPSTACTGRSQGSDVAPAAGSDPWGAVTPAMIDKMAQKGLDLVKACVNASTVGNTAQPQGIAPQQLPKT